MEDASPDHDERLKDFFARHGGPGPRGIRRGQSAGGVQGWSEAHAGDGYVLRCDWSTFGTREEMKYSEIAPKPWGYTMIRKISTGEYRLYSRKLNPKTKRRRNLGTFKTRAAAEKHEREVQYFKRH
jgi:hypothetical protein